MNYCTIEDAWNNNDYITNQFKIYENPYRKKNIETFETEKKIETFETEPKIPIYTNQNTQLNNQDLNIDLNNQNYLNNFNIPQMNYDNVFICDDFWDHLNTCKSCRMKVRERFSSKITDKVENLILDNKDTVLIFLVCLFALLFCNLLISIINK